MGNKFQKIGANKKFFYLYAISRSQKAVAEREHMFEPGDLLDLFKFLQKM